MGYNWLVTKLQDCCIGLVDFSPEHNFRTHLPLEDSNVANHLFRVGNDILKNPALINAQWDNAGKLLDEDIWSFCELQHKVLKCIYLLQSQGIGKGMRTLLLVRPGQELIVICFALFRLGAVPIVIDPGMGLSKFKRAVAHSKPEALVGISKAILISKLFKQSFRTIKHRILVNESKFLSELDLQKHDTISEIEPTQNDDLAAILFTSGSTGPPKGVCYEHGMFNAQIELLKTRFDIRPGEIDLPMLPLFALFNPAMGMTTVIPEINPSRPATVNPAKIVAAIERYQVTNTFGSPVLWRIIGDYCQEHSRTLASLKRILVAGAAAPTSLYRQYETLLPNGQIFSPYGATECLPVSVIEGQLVLDETARMSDAGKGICVGTPVDGVQVRIIKDSDNATIDDLPQGEIGEILVHGPSVTKQYDALHDATQASKIQMGSDTWHRMGDMGYLDDSGRLWFCGRKVERVYVGSETLYTECVEGVFNRFHRIKRSALIQYKGSAALVIEPVSWGSLRHVALRRKFVQEMRTFFEEQSIDLPVDNIFFIQAMPVDVRHNAKIHRLTLAKRFANRNAYKLQVV